MRLRRLSKQPCNPCSALRAPCSASAPYQSRRSCPENSPYPQASYPQPPHPNHTHSLAFQVLSRPPRPIQPSSTCPSPCTLSHRCSGVAVGRDQAPLLGGARAARRLPAARRRRTIDLAGRANDGQPTATSAAAAPAPISATTLTGRVRESRSLLRGCRAQGPGRAARGARLQRNPTPPLHACVLYACLARPIRAAAGTVLLRRQALSRLGVASERLLCVGRVGCGLAVHTRQDLRRGRGHLPSRRREALHC